jgi:hypothetical protein
MDGEEIQLADSPQSGDEAAADERRVEPRTDTAFFAVEIRGRDLYYRLVRNISESGFSFDDHFPLDRPGDSIVMEFPLPGSVEPIRIDGRVVYARPDRGVGVRIERVESERYRQLIAVPPPVRRAIHGEPSR